tara:strand:+ start:554 stop:1054 length:501 start_codon:yes stop_codon:yes gene_type:complete
MCSMNVPLFFHLSVLPHGIFARVQKKVGRSGQRVGRGVMADRQWFDFSGLGVTGVDLGPVQSFQPVTPLRLPPPALLASSLASSGWVERRTGDFCGCCGNFGNCCGIGTVCCKPVLEVDEFGRLVSRPRCFGLKTSNFVGLVLYALVLACAVLLFYALSLILTQIV